MAAILVLVVYMEFHDICVSFFFSFYFRSLIANTYMCSCTHGTKLTLVATRIFFNTKPYKYCLTVVALLTVSFIFFYRRQPWRVKYVHTERGKKRRYLSSVVSRSSLYSVRRRKQRHEMRTYTLNWLYCTMSTSAVSVAAAATLWKRWICVLVSFSQLMMYANARDTAVCVQVYYESSCVFVIVMMIDRRCWFPPFWFHKTFFSFRSLLEIIRFDANIWVSVFF